ncbi:MAG: DUF5519 family protein [Anaerolineae bacterium]|jgi:hypothetical protein|nr:DUF5519 family protein [Anaerolineae bacterium]
MGSISDRITEAVMALDGVTSATHRFGGVEFHVKNREIGHLHGDRMADLPFPKRVRDQLISEGKAQTHHLLKDTGWVSYYLNGEADIEPVIALFQLNYRVITDRKSVMADLQE